MIDYQFKPFAEMTAEDYAIVGFKSGLEVHQQLLTEKKLFCRCPAGRYSNSFEGEILRHMRPTLSELGEYDGTALMEFKTKKEILYRINHETVCTYEMDDTPPFELNDEALDNALAIAMLYNMTMVDELHIARKQYLDGSIPTGFQRTTIVGVDGKIPYKDREIRIVQLGLEEDACREVSDVGHLRTYITDRLGMPLIETVTAPEMRTPTEVAEVGERIRRLVRSTGRVRTGIGAGRQDVNVSVTGGTRIEIKGVSRIPLIPLLTYNEAMRQWNLLRLKEELARRNITTETFSARVEDATRLLKRVRYDPIRRALNRQHVVKCVLLRGYRGLMLWQTQTDTYFFHEISDRVRVIACLTSLPNIIHSDSHSETIASAEWRTIKKQMGCTDADALVLVWGSQEDAEMGANEIVIRAREATIGIPSETRQALFDGTNGFERILPGPDRMYPDTDLPPKKITADRLERIRATLPAPYWHNESWYRSLGLRDDVVNPLSISPFAPLFEKFVHEWNLDPAFVAHVLIRFPKKLKKLGYDVYHLTPEIMNSIFTSYKEGLLCKDGLIEAMKQAIRAQRFSSDVLPPLCSQEEVRRIIASAKEKMKRIKLRNPKNKTELLMGTVMNQVRGRVDGSVIAAELSVRKKGAK